MFSSRLGLVLKTSLLELSSSIGGGGIFESNLVGDGSSLIDRGSGFCFTVTVDFSIALCWGVVGIFSIETLNFLLGLCDVLLLLSFLSMS